MRPAETYPHPSLDEDALCFRLGIEHTE
jgi:hypothetical protein